MSSPVIECVELTKAYGKRIVALNNLTLTLNEGATVANMMIGAIGLLVNCIFISTLTFVLSLPVATRRVQIVFLAWLVAVLYSNSNLGPAAGFLAVSRIPLAPLAVCYNLGATGTMSWYGLLMLALAVGYVVGLALLAEFWLARRDLLLQ